MLVPSLLLIEQIREILECKSALCSTYTWYTLLVSQLNDILPDLPRPLQAQQNRVTNYCLKTCMLVHATLGLHNEVWLVPNSNVPRSGYSYSLVSSAYLMHELSIPEIVIWLLTMHILYDVTDVTDATSIRSFNTNRITVVPSLEVAT